MVRVAVALPLGPGVTESELSEQRGAPGPAGCTEQANATGLSNEFSKVTVTVELELCPPEMVPGVGFEAEIEKSVPLLSSTPIVLSPLMLTKSGALSPFRSAANPKLGLTSDATVKPTSGWNVPSPLPSNTATCMRVFSEPAMSSLPSPS